MTGAGILRPSRCQARNPWTAQARIAGPAILGSDNCSFIWWSSTAIWWLNGIRTRRFQITSSFDAALGASFAASQSLNIGVKSNSGLKRYLAVTMSPPVSVLRMLVSNLRPSETS